MKIDIAGIYFAIAVFLMLGAMGSLFSVIIQWHTSDIGMKIGGISGMFINVLFGFAMFYFWNQQKHSPMMMNPTDFDEVFNREVKNEKSLGTTRRQSK